MPNPYEQVHRKDIREVLNKLQVQIESDGDVAQYVMEVYEDKILISNESVEESRKIQPPTILWNKSKADLIAEFTELLTRATPDRVSIYEGFINQLENEA